MFFEMFHERDLQHIDGNAEVMGNKNCLVVAIVQVKQETRKTLLLSHRGDK